MTYNTIMAINFDELFVQIRKEVILHLYDIMLDQTNEQIGKDFREVITNHKNEIDLIGL